MAGQTVVITGASAGIGRATAIAFGRQGARVGLIARDVEGLEAACNDVQAVGGQGLILPADVSDPRAIDAAAGRVEQEWGSIDVWVNCAMVTSFSPFAMMTPDEYRRITEVTYLGEVYGTMAALRRMRARNRGTIVQVGSALAYRAIPLQSAYCGAKHAVRGFTDSLRSELLHERSGVRLTMVQLPAVNTPQFEWARNRLARAPRPVPPIFQPEAAAQAIVQAAENAPRELWVGLSSIEAILVNMWLPDWLDRFLSKRGYVGQLSREPADPRSPDNLYSPVRRLHSVHGRFDAQAHGRVLTVKAATVRKVVLSLVTGLALIIGAVGYRAGRRYPDGGAAPLAHKTRE